MRILTVRQPWAWAIIHGGKDVENRVRNIAGSYRGTVAIHAGLSAVSPTDPSWLSAPLNGLPVAERLNARGAIIGVVDLVDVHPVANAHFHPICYDRARPNGLLEAAERGDGVCSPWSTPDARYHLVLANPRPLATPIPFKGALGLRTLPGDIEAQIQQQLIERTTR